VGGGAVGVGGGAVGVGGGAVGVGGVGEVAHAKLSSAHISNTKPILGVAAWTNIWFLLFLGFDSIVLTV
jgi:hypothetical protein